MERFLDYFNPEYYWLELYVFSKKRLIRGTVTIEGEVKSDCVKFHGVNLKIKSVSFQPLHWMGAPRDSDYQTCPYEYDGQTLKIPITSEMRIRIAKQVKINYDDDFDDRQMVVFRIEYEAPINSSMEGCYLSSYDYDGQEREIVATQFESHYARETFPCIDEPAAKAKFCLVLLTPDIAPGDVVLSNMPLFSKNHNRYTFETTPKMSTYLLAWVIGPFQSISTVNKNGVRVSSYCPLNQSIASLYFANQTAVRALEYYETKFQHPYPLAKLDQVALPDFEFGAMENWGLITFRESCMLVDPKAPLSTKRQVATTVTHELAHQWFGNLVTMRWWDDLWLNEAFASVMEYYASDAIYPELKVWPDFFTGDCWAALNRDALPGVQSVRQAVHDPAEIATLFDSAIVYAKGARLIYMLIKLMGEANFYAGINQYFAKHAYGNTVGDDLWFELQQFADFDVKEFMDAWISQPGYPAITGTKQQRFLIAGEASPETWPLSEIRDDMSGHYLINLSAQEFQTKLQNFAELSTEQQLRLLIDRLFLAKTPAVTSVSLFDLLPKFAHEQSAEVLTIVVDMVNSLKLFCPPESPAETNFKTYLQQLFASEFAQLDFSAALDDNTIRRRGLLLGLALYVRDAAALSKLVKMYHPDLSQIDSELREFVLYAKLLADEKQVFSEFLQQYQKAADPDLKSDLLYALVSAAHAPEHLERLVQLLDQPKIVRPQDHIFLFAYLMRNYRTRSAALDWLINHWDYVMQLTGEKSVEDYLRYAAVTITTEDLAEQFNEFCRSLHKYTFLERGINLAEVSIAARLKLIQLDAPAVQTKLEALMESKA